MRTRAKFLAEVAKFTLKNIKRVEVQFDPFHPNAASVREFYQGVADRKPLRTNIECVTRAKVVCDQSDPLVTVLFKDGHKLVINSKYLESNHIIKLIKQFELNHQNEPEAD